MTRSSDPVAWLLLLSKESDLVVEGAGGGGVDGSPSNESQSDKLWAVDSLFFCKQIILLSV